MSYTALHVGIIRELPIKNDENTIEKYCQNVCELLNLTLNDSSWPKYSSYFDRLQDYYYEKYGNYLVRDAATKRLFIAIDEEHDDYVCDLITDSKIGGDDAYPYVLYFDNGGTTAIDEIESLIKDKICKQSDK